MASISYQLYSSRNHAIEDTAQMLENLGIKETEGFGPLYEDPAATRALLDRHGLTMPTGHVSMDQVENDPEGTLRIAETLGFEAVIVPFLMPDDRPTDKAGWAAFAKRFAAAGKPILDAGLAYGWHNHDFEFTRTADGCMPIEEIMGASDDISMELDLAWVAVAGEDPIAWINRYSGRIIAAHVKDRAPAGENADEDGWADVGHGTMDWDKIVPALKAAGVNRYILEHDNPSDHTRFASRSVETVRSF